MENRRRKCINLIRKIINLKKSIRTEVNEKKNYEGKMRTRDPRITNYRLDNGQLSEQIHALMIH